MSELQLDPCRHCLGDLVLVCRTAEAGHYHIEVFAAVCQTCGARGPQRVCTSLNDREHVRALAADDWNIETAPDKKQENYSENYSSPVPHETKLPSADPALPQPALPTAEPAQPPDSGGGLGDTPADEIKPITPPIKPAKKQQATADQKEVTQRLQGWLKRNKTSIETATIRDEIHLGVSKATLYHMVNGKPMSQRTLELVTAALDKLEAPKQATVEDMKAEDPHGEVGPSITIDESKVEKIGNKFGPAMKPRTHTPPARCARTP